MKKKKHQHPADQRLNTLRSLLRRPIVKEDTKVLEQVFHLLFHREDERLTSLFAEPFSDDALSYLEDVIYEFGQARLLETTAGEMELVAATILVQITVPAEKANTLPDFLPAFTNTATSERLIRKAFNLPEEADVFLDGHLYVTDTEDWQRESSTFHYLRSFGLTAGKATLSRFTETKKKVEIGQEGVYLLQRAINFLVLAPVEKSNDIDDALFGEIEAETFPVIPEPIQERIVVLLTDELKQLLSLDVESPLLVSMDSYIERLDDVPLSAFMNQLIAQAAVEASIGATKQEQHPNAPVKIHVFPSDGGLVANIAAVAETPQPVTLSKVEFPVMLFEDLEPIVDAVLDIFFTTFPNCTVINHTIEHVDPVASYFREKRRPAPIKMATNKTGH